MKKVLVGITGASGIDYARVLVRELYNKDCKIYLIVTDSGKLVMEKELGFKLKGEPWEQDHQLKKYFEIPVRENERFVILDNCDLAAPVASGSFQIDSMVVIPCSMATVSSIACGTSNDLLERAADVAIKEGRKLILVPRETPLSRIHLQNMLLLSEMGVTILPAMPAFYYRPRTIDDMLKFIAGRILENLNIKHDLYDPWGQERARLRKGEVFKYKIGILQLTSHLDDTVEGFKKGISSIREAELFYDYRNVEGQVPLLGRHAEELVDEGVDLIFACTTPAAKAAAAATENKGIPVVFTPVLDPVKVGLAASWESSENNLTGVSGLVPSDLKLDKFREIYPGLRKLVIIYEDENPNTAIELECVLAAAGHMGISTEAFPVREIEDLRGAFTERTFNSGDVFFVPISPLVEQNISLLVTAAKKHKIPIMAPNEGNVKAGALLGLAADHFDLGVSAGLMSAEILQGKDPADIPIGLPEQPRLFINLSAARHLNLELSSDILEQAAGVY